jgi:uncharacterized membrane protein
VASRTPTSSVAREHGGHAAAPVETAARRRSRVVGASALVGMGVLHVVAPKPFLAIIPRWLPAPKALNLAAGAAEAASGALLLSKDPQRRRLGGALAAATIVGVYPANIQMAVDVGRPTKAFDWGIWFRLPFQLPMITWALGHARGPR